MVLWTRNQLDDFGQYVMKLVASELETMGKPASDFLSIVQDGTHLSPAILLQTPHGQEGFSVEYEHQAWNTSETELRAVIRGRLESAYRAG
ncbi:MAG: hypothetical protein AABO58_25925 [Acidobacteriota bacterium]